MTFMPFDTLQQPDKFSLGLVNDTFSVAGITSNQELPSLLGGKMVV
jgi:hypothetical protein